MRRRFPDLSKFERFYLGLSIGRKRYFFDKTRKGWVLGPRDANDHITVGLRDLGEESEPVQVHRKMKGEEVWRHTQRSMIEGLMQFWDTNSEIIGQSVLGQSQTYLVSVYRVNLLYNLLMGLITVGYELFGQFFLALRVTKLDERTIMIDLGVKKERILHFLNSLKNQFFVLSWILSRIPPQVSYAVAKSAAKVFLINPENHDDLENGIGFLLSSQRVGIVISNDKGELRHLPYSSLVTLYESVERNLPLGKLKELTDFSQRGFSLEVKVPEQTR